MSGIRKFFKVFLASPNDLADERKTAKRVVDEYNGQVAKITGYHAELVGWEDTLPGMGRPQARINRDLEGCDLFVGMLWKRWGTPPDNSSKNTSGFEEEFNLSLQRYETEHRPQIHLLLKNIEETALIDPGDQLKRVQEFRTKIFSEKKLLIKTFQDVSDFERTFRQCITGFAVELQEIEETEEPQKSRLPTPSAAHQPTGDSVEPTESFLPNETLLFLKEFLKNSQKGKDYTPPANAVARFRLVSTLISTSGNDQTHLGAHDSNLLFRERRSIALSQQEKIALLDAGLEKIQSENAPIWHWLASTNGFEEPVLLLASLGGSSTSLKAGAITAMRLISQPIRDVAEINRELVIDTWLDKGSESIVRNAALDYLAECGTLKDVPRLRNELGTNDYQIENGAVKAILRILEREEPDQLFAAVIDLRPATIEKSLLNRLITKTTPETKALVQAVDQKSAALRRMAVAELRRRKALLAPLAEKLLADDSAYVRYEAMIALVASGRVMSPEQVKSTLIRKKGNSSSGNAGILLALANKDSEGESLYESYAQEQKIALPDAELAEEAKNSVVDHDAFFALARKDPKSYKTELRDAVADQFKSKFNSALTKLSETFPVNDNLTDKIRDLDEFLRKKFTRRGLDLIEHEMDKTDLALVRNIFRSGFINSSPLDWAYLKKFGDWSDAPSIIESLNRNSLSTSLTLLGSDDEDRYEVVASTLYSLAENRIWDLFSLTLPKQIVLRLIRQISTSKFREIPEDELMRLLQSKEDRIRKFTALKITSAFSQKKINAILSAYLAADQYYYNVIHWLDFGTSAPRDVVMRGVACEMRDNI